MRTEELLRQYQQRKQELIDKANGQMEKMPSSEREEFRELRFQCEHLSEQIKLKKYVAKQIREKANLGKRFESRTFENFDSSKQPRAYEVCRRYASNFSKVCDREKNSIILMGNCGTGKTHLIASIANYVIDEFGVAVIYDTWAGHLDKIKAEFDGKKKVYLNLICTCDLLVIDDYGQDKPSAFNDEILYTVINSRYEKNLPVLMTTNIANLSERMKNSVQSRLLEMSVCEMVEGKDMRK